MEQNGIFYIHFQFSYNKAGTKVFSPTWLTSPFSGSAGHTVERNDVRPGDTSPKYVTEVVGYGCSELGAIFSAMLTATCIQCCCGTEHTANYAF